MFCSLSWIDGTCGISAALGTDDGDGTCWGWDYCLAMLFNGSVAPDPATGMLNFLLRRLVDYAFALL